MCADTFRNMTSSRRLLVSLLAAALVATLAPAASATHGRVHSWTGRATYIADGDTFDIDLDGDGTSKVFRVRVAGIQTMEIGECHAAPATRSLKGLIHGKKVRLRAVNPASRAHDGPNRSRLLRFVDVKRNGRWVDVGRMQIRRGHALWHPHPVENLHDAQYHRDAVKAAAVGKNLWSPNKCRSGPYANLPLRMWLQSDADGNDFGNINGEWIKLHNTSATQTLNLSRWRLRLAAGEIVYRMARGTKIPPGQTLTLHIGSGRDTALTKYWGRGRPLFRNVGDGKAYVGEGIYLYDRDLDLRSHYFYPCVIGCSDPLQGKVAVGAINYDGPGSHPEPANGEWVHVVNTSTGFVDLYGYLLESWPYSYAFTPGTQLAPGQSLQVFVGKGVDTPLTKFWGLGEGILNNGGDTVRLRTFDYITLDCKAWGSARC